MKKIYKLITILLFLFSTYSYSQEYPRYEIDSFGEKVVIMTIEQAQKLDNATDLLALFEKLDLQIKNYDSVCVRVINEQEEIIALQKIQILKFKELVDVNSKQIENLQLQIKLYIDKVDVLESQISNREGVIKELNKQIRNLKTKLFISSTVGTAAILGFIYIIFVGL